MNSNLADELWHNLFAWLQGCLKRGAPGRNFIFNWLSRGGNCWETLFITVPDWYCFKLMFRISSETINVWFSVAASILNLKRLQQSLIISYQSYLPLSCIIIQKGRIYHNHLHLWSFLHPPTVYYNLTIRLSNAGVDKWPSCSRSPGDNSDMHACSWDLKRVDLNL